MSYTPATSSGSKLLGSVAYDPGTLVSKSLASLLAMTAFDTTNARITFTAPASGKVFWRLRCLADAGSDSGMVLLGVLDGATVKARIACPAFVSTTVGGTPLEASGVITGLTPSTSYSFDAAYGIENAVSSRNLAYGGPNNTTADDAAGAIIFEIWEVVT